MFIFPAIDLYDKKAVRLFKGDYAQMTVYSENPIEIARDFEAAGARFIHMVDLEGARDGTTPNLSVVSDVARNTSLFVEIGGGIRDMKTVETYRTQVFPVSSSAQRRSTTKPSSAKR